jgi:hypothetical protein
MDNQAGPSRLKQQPAALVVEPKEDVDDPRPSAPPSGNSAAQAEEGDEDEERMDFKAIESIARLAEFIVSPIRADNTVRSNMLKELGDQRSISQNEERRISSLYRKRSTYKK